MIEDLKLLNLKQFIFPDLFQLSPLQLFSMTINVHLSGIYFCLLRLGSSTWTNLEAGNLRKSHSLEIIRTNLSSLFPESGYVQVPVKQPPEFSEKRGEINFNWISDHWMQKKKLLWLTSNIWKKENKKEANRIIWKIPNLLVRLFIYLYFSLQLVGHSLFLILCSMSMSSSNT